MSWLRGMLAACCIVAVLSCSAQQEGKLPDSISTSEDNLAPPPAPRDSSTVFSTDSTSVDSTLQDSVRQAADSAVLRIVPDSVADQFKRNRDFAYANDPAYWTRAAPDTGPEWGFLAFLARLFASKAFRACLYILLGAVLLFVLYRIISENNLHLFYKSSRNSAAASRTQQETSLMEEDLDNRIREALLAGDHRLGTRWLFLKALRLLDEHGLIRYQARATNQEYMLQMSPYPQAKGFCYLAGAYEHVWYGNFSLSGEQFDRLLHEFQEFYKTMPPAA